MTLVLPFARFASIPSSKKAEILIDREQVVAVDPGKLPEDAEFKGHEDMVVQDIILKTDNILFHLRKYYVPWISI